MDQRTSIMISAILFAAVVAGSISYLIYTRPSGDQVALTSPSPTATPEATPLITPIILTDATPTPVPTSANQAEASSVVAPVSPSAATGPVETTIAVTLGMTVLGAWGIRRLV